MQYPNSHSSFLLHCSFRLLLLAHLQRMVPAICPFIVKAAHRQRQNGGLILPQQWTSFGLFCQWKVAAFTHWMFAQTMASFHISLHSIPFFPFRQSRSFIIPWSNSFRYWTLVRLLAHFDVLHFSILAVATFWCFMKWNCAQPLLLVTLIDGSLLIVPENIDAVAIRSLRFSFSEHWSLTVTFFLEGLAGISASSDFPCILGHFPLLNLQAPCFSTPLHNEWFFTLSIAEGGGVSSIVVVVVELRRGYEDPTSLRQSCGLHHLRGRLCGHLPHSWKVLLPQCSSSQWWRNKAFNHLFLECYHKLTRVDGMGERVSTPPDRMERGRPFLGENGSTYMSLSLGAGHRSLTLPT